MPTYSYACTECDNRFDAVQAFTDDALTTCPKCSGRLRKLFNSVGVVFKGSGFYRTDSRESAAKSGSSAGEFDQPPRSPAARRRPQVGDSGSGSSPAGSGASTSSGSAPAAASS